jgi:hypothetical protein
VITILSVAAPMASIGGSRAGPSPSTTPPRVGAVVEAAQHHPLRYRALSLAALDCLARSRRPRSNSHLLSTHRYQLTTASCIAAQRIALSVVRRIEHDISIRSQPTGEGGTDEAHRETNRLESS